MLFPSIQFLLFFIIVFLLGIFFKRYKTVFKFYLLFVSFFFYVTWSLVFFGILVGNIIINFCFNKLAEDKSKFFLILGIITNLIFLGIFKYYNFFVESLYNLLSSSGIQSSITTLQIIAPIGISFYTFKNISHLVDVYKGKVNDFTFINFANYISFFPQVISGPIARAQDFYEDLNKENKSDYSKGEVISLFLLGFFKKYAVSSFLFQIVEQPFTTPLNYTSIELFVAVLAYSALIYVDFSGYVDIANSISLLFGFRITENFNLPYSATSISDFWRRWHITLSTWFKDYLYIPLGGNRKGVFRKYLNTIIVMLVSGLWHGAGVVFIIWGLLHGIGMVLGDILSKIFAYENKSRAMHIIAVPLTFVSVSLLWVFFNSKSLPEALNYFNQMFSLTDITSTGSNGSGQILTPLVIGVIVLVLFMNFTEIKIRNYLKRLLDINILLTLVITAALVFVIVNLGPDQLPPFIYSKF